MRPARPPGADRQRLFRHAGGCAQGPRPLADARALGAPPALLDVASRFGVFGFGLLERLPDGRWRYTAYDRKGGGCCGAW
jgi:hypothetical protein